MTPEEKTYLEWRKKRRDVGCVFARLLAIDPALYQQRVVRVRGGDAAGLATEIDDLVAHGVASPDVAALTIVMPGLVQLETFVGVAFALPGAHGWKVTRRLIPTTPAGAVVAFGVTREVPFTGGTTLPSEVLFLGDFAAFPPTRRAPISALEIFVGQPRTHDPKTGEPSTKANLAHIKVAPPAATQVEKSAWDNSPKERRASLGLSPLGGADDDLRAKAKVSFVIPLDLAVERGWAP